jgi:hypothetical protein
MDTEKLKQFIVPIAILCLTLVGIGYVAPKIVNNVQTYRSVQADNVTKESTLQEKNSELDALKKKAQEEKEKENSSSDKPFYKPVMTGLDTEAVIAGEFAEILRLVRANQIKVRSIKYDYDPQDDAFVQGAGDKYNVARLNMEMISNYSNYDNFLKEMYKHDHFLDIQSAEIVPYKKNKKVLLINFRVKLYAKK